MEKENVRQKLEVILEEQLDNINFLAIFGSTARGTNNPASDIDLFYDLDNCTLLPEFEDRILEQFPGVKVDLVPILEVLKEEQDIVFEYFVEGSEILYESKRVYNFIKDERTLARYKGMHRGESKTDSCNSLQENRNKFTDWQYLN